MNRREFMFFLGGAMTAARALRAQPKPMPVIGYLTTGSASSRTLAPNLAAFRQGLSDIGYVEGQNVAIEYRWAEGQYDRLPALAADLVGRKVEVIATSGGPMPVARRKAQPRRSRSSSWEPATRSGTGWSPVSPGRAVTLRASAPCKPN
jgi:putative ABC transport system substrate-binding protein